MRYFIMISSIFLALGCMLEAGEEEPSSDRPVESSALELKTGVHFGGGLVFGNNDCSDCLHDCSLLKQSCETGNLGILTDRFELAEPCDLDYSICKGNCNPVCQPSPQ